MQAPPAVAPRPVPSGTALAELLARLDPHGDQDLLIGTGLLLRWRRGRVAVIEPAFDPVARLLVAGMPPDSVTAALARDPAGPAEAGGLALLARLAGTDADAPGASELVRLTAEELTTEAAAELLGLPSEGLVTRPVPDGPVPLPAAADLSLTADELVHLADRRLEALAELRDAVPGPSAIPTLTGRQPSEPTAATGLAAAVLARTDGRRTVAEIAAACGLTRFETATTLAAFADEGLVTILPSDLPWPTRVDAPTRAVRTVDTSTAWMTLRELAARTDEPAAAGNGGRPAPDQAAPTGGDDRGDESATQPPVPPRPAATGVDASALLRELARFNLDDGADEPAAPEPTPWPRPAPTPPTDEPRDERARPSRFGFLRGSRR